MVTPAMAAPFSFNCTAGEGVIVALAGCCKKLRE